MKTLYIDCGMGAAGDMLTAALLELTEDRDGVVDELNHLGIPGVEYNAEKAEKCGITGTHMTVRVHGVEEESEDVHSHGHSHHDHDHYHEDHDHEDHHHHEEIHEGHEHPDHEDHHHEHHEHHHHHSSLHDIEHIVEGMQVSDRVKKDVMNVYHLIAEAESHAHGKPVTEIHFHEVGTMDAVADVTAVCLLMEKLSPEQVIVSPVHVGSGQVKCAHGILPVPAPATAFILRDVPIYGGEIRGELCTPTGAALLKYFATGFGAMPVMSVSAIGYGMGKKDFERANCVRVLLGENFAAEKTGEGFTGKTSDRPLAGKEKEASGNERIVKLECNIDDIAGEDLGFAMEKLYEAGAKEVFMTAVQMKKSRPGILLSVLCDFSAKDLIIRTIFEHTTTIGIREFQTARYVLSRREEVVSTKFGPVRKKISEGYGVRKEKYEFEDLAEIARVQKLSLKEVIRRISEE